LHLSHEIEGCKIKRHTLVVRRRNKN